MLNPARVRVGARNGETRAEVRSAGFGRAGPPVPTGAVEPREPTSSRRWPTAVWGWPGPTARGWGAGSLATGAAPLSAYADYSRRQVKQRGLLRRGSVTVQGNAGGRRFPSLLSSRRSQPMATCVPSKSLPPAGTGRNRRGEAVRQFSGIYVIRPDTFGCPHSRLARSEGKARTGHPKCFGWHVHAPQRE